MSTVKINSSSLENIKRQYRQDCQLVFQGYVYNTDLQSLEYAKRQMPVDKDGYPTPVTRTQIAELVSKMEEQADKARRLYIDRVAKIERKTLTKEAESQHEQVE